MIKEIFSAIGSVARAAEGAALWAEDTVNGGRKLTNTEINMLSKRQDLRMEEIEAELQEKKANLAKLLNHNPKQPN